MPEPTRITFVTHDDDTDGVAVLHDGETVWAESSLADLDQYFRFYAPTGVPVIVEWAVIEGGRMTEGSSLERDR